MSSGGNQRSEDMEPSHESRSSTMPIGWSDDSSILHTSPYEPPAGSPIAHDMANALIPISIATPLRS